MPQPAPGKDLQITPSQVITISQNGNVLQPSVDPATIPLGGSIQFVNNTSQGVAIELFTKENNHHVAISLYLAPSGQAILCNDPQHSNSACHYNLVAYGTIQQSPTETTSGGHTIVIGSNEP